jgi:hypothetical protein
MSNRIDELACEAGLPTYDPEKIPFKLKKFAELILKECLYYSECDDVEFMRFLIEKNFGVKYERKD